jgi:hypothetical protein
MIGAIPPLPNTPSWRGAQLKDRDNFTFTFASSLVVKRTKASSKIIIVSSCGKLKCLDNTNLPE